MSWIKYNFSKETINNIIDLYQTKSVFYIAKQYNVDDSVIKRVLKQNNIIIRNNNFYKCKNLNESYFNVIDTAEKAYWLGFIYADGYITKRKNSDCFGISLSDKDIDHLIKFKNCINSSHKIGIYINKTGFNVEKHLKCCKICIYNQNFVNNLFNKGVLYNKSKILISPTLEQVPKEFISHFIRGYFDGDGSVYKTNDGGCVSILGTKNICEWILKYFKTVVNTNVKIYKYKNKDIYEFKIGGINNFKDCFKYLYKDADVYLERKYQKFLNIFNNHKIDVQRL